VTDFGTFSLLVGRDERDQVIWQLRRFF